MLKLLVFSAPIYPDSVVLHVKINSKNKWSAGEMLTTRTAYTNMTEHTPARYHEDVYLVLYANLANSFSA